MIRKTNITNEEYEGMNGTITGEFETEQERIEFENLNGLQSGKFFQVSNKNMIPLIPLLQGYQMRVCLHGKVIDLHKMNPINGAVMLLSKNQYN